MIMRDIENLLNKEKRKRERVKTAKYAVGYAVGMVAVAAAGVAIGIIFSPKSGKEIREHINKKSAAAVETIKDKIQKKEETVEDSMAHIVKDLGKDIKDVHEKTKGIKKDI